MSLSRDRALASGLPVEEDIDPWAQIIERPPGFAVAAGDELENHCSPTQGQLEDQHHHHHRHRHRHRHQLLFRSRGLSSGNGIIGLLWLLVSQLGAMVGILFILVLLHSHWGSNLDLDADPRVTAPATAIATTIPWINEADLNLDPFSQTAMRSHHAAKHLATLLPTNEIQNRLRNFNLHHNSSRIGSDNNSLALQHLPTVSTLHRLACAFRAVAVQSYTCPASALARTLLASATAEQTYVLGLVLRARTHTVAGLSPGSGSSYLTVLARRLGWAFTEWEWQPLRWVMCWDLDDKLAKVRQRAKRSIKWLIRDDAACRARVAEDVAVILEQVGAMCSGLQRAGNSERGRLGIDPLVLAFWAVGTTFCEEYGVQTTRELLMQVDSDAPVDVDGNGPLWITEVRDAIQAWGLVLAYGEEVQQDVVDACGVGSAYAMAGRFGQAIGRGWGLRRVMDFIGLA